MGAARFRPDTGHLTFLIPALWLSLAWSPLRVRRIPMISGAALLAALVLGLVNAFLRPLAILLALPLNILTFGLLWWLIRWVVNAMMLWLTSAIVPGFKVRSFGPAFWGSALLTLGNLLLSWIF